MTSLIQNLVFGLFVGSIYGIAAVGLALVFGVMKILNVAHGELLMIGGYVSFWLFRAAGIDPFVSISHLRAARVFVGSGLEPIIFSTSCQNRIRNPRFEIRC